MSRSLPERPAIIGLFPGMSWFRMGGKDLAVRANGATADALPLLGELDALLGDNPELRRPGRRVTVIASDSVAAVASLPWRDALSGMDEVRGFALACFERQHQEIGHDWVVHAGFRHFRRLGLAHAFARAWVEELTALLARHGLLLERVLPVSAWSYWGGRPPRQAGTGVVFVQETTRHSAHVFDRRGLMGIDVEVIAGSPAQSAKRLLQRVGAYHPDIKHIWHWSCEARPDAADALDLAGAVPGATVLALQRDAWI